MNENQKDKFRDAVEEKNQAAQAAAKEQQLIDTDESQDSYDVRAKSTGHKKKTADKWNQ